MYPYNQEQKREIMTEIWDRLNEILESGDVSIDDKERIWKNILFVLDALKEGCFFGKLSMEMRGFRINDIKEEERTHRMVSMYKNITQKIEKLK